VQTFFSIFVSMVTSLGFQSDAKEVITKSTVPQRTTIKHQAYKTERDILYYDDDDLTDYQRERCKLDVYHPVDQKGFATVVWLHAGGLKRGKRYVPGELRNKGLAVVAVDYRLSPQVTAPAYIEDAAAALAWTIENIEQYGGAPDKVIVAGASAGGYLSLMVGLDKRWLAKHEIDANRLAGIAALGGQTIVHVAVREERGIKRTRAVVDDLAPMHHARGDAPPVLLVTGDRELELLGRYEENALMWRLMKLEGHKDTTLHELEGFDHAGLEKPAHGLLLRFVERSTELTGSEGNGNPTK